MELTEQKDKLIIAIRKLEELKQKLGDHIDNSAIEDIDAKIKKSWKDAKDASLEKAINILASDVDIFQAFGYLLTHLQITNLLAVLPRNEKASDLFAKAQNPFNKGYPLDFYSRWMGEIYKRSNGDLNEIPLEYLAEAGFIQGYLDASVGYEKYVKKLNNSELKDLKETDAKAMGRLKEYFQKIGHTMSLKEAAQKRQDIDK